MGRLVIPYAAGIWAGAELQLSPVSCSIAFGVLSLFLSINMLTPLRIRYSLGPLSGIMLLGMVTCSGALSTAIQAQKNRHAAYFIGEGTYRFVIEEVTPSRQGGLRLLTRAARAEGNTLKPIPGKTLVYAPPGSIFSNPSPGETFFAPTRLQAIRGPLNPGEPDFRRIYARDGIYTSTVLRAGRFTVVGSRTGWSLNNSLHRHRNFMLQTLRRHIRDSSAAGLAEAILVGYRNDLSPELGQAYARTGVMHVIAISGLHLGLIFSILLSIFRIIPGNGRKPWLPLLIAVPAIWWFSLLTGASASVIRSAVMSSLPVLGAIIQRRTWTINVCCGSILLLLAWNPAWLWDAGFQLSYGAVWGILLYQRPLLKQLPMRHPAAAYTWELVAVTLAAQVFTTPLVVYYFHQFPLLFLFANMLAVPLSSIILLGTMLICLLPAFPGMASKLGEWTEWMIHFLNNFIRRIDMVPSSLLEHLYLDSKSLVLVFGFLICLHLCARFGVRGWYAPTLAVAALLVASIITGARSAATRSGLCILQVRGHSVILHLQGRKAQQLLLPSPQHSADRIPLVLAASRQHFRTRAYQTTLLNPASVQVIRTGTRTIILTGGAYHDGLKGKLPPADLVLLHANAGSSSLESWFRATGCRQFVADGSNSLWKIQRWTEEAKKLPLRLHSTPLHGAFLLD